MGLLTTRTLCAMHLWDFLLPFSHFLLLSGWKRFHQVWRGTVGYGRVRRCGGTVMSAGPPWKDFLSTCLSGGGFGPFVSYRKTWMWSRPLRHYKLFILSQDKIIGVFRHGCIYTGAGPFNTQGLEKVLCFIYMCPGEKWMYKNVVPWIFAKVCAGEKLCIYRQYSVMSVQLASCPNKQLCLCFIQTYLYLEQLEQRIGKEFSHMVSCLNKSILFKFLYDVLSCDLLKWFIRHSYGRMDTYHLSFIIVSLMSE